VRKIFLGFIYIYRGFSPIFHFLSNMFGVPGQCKYPVTCSEFAVVEMKSNKSVFSALRRIFLRVLSCNPITGVLS
jgi:putative component of membrane protein insertase Oxa1/YidC/SpoIIIJ protein YidD